MAESNQESKSCNICGADGMQIKTLVLTYEIPGQQEKELEVQGEVCDQCDEIVLKDILSNSDNEE